MATIRRPPGVEDRNTPAGADAQAWQSLIEGPAPLRRRAQLQIGSGLPAESHLGSIDSEDPWIASRRASRGGNPAAGKKPHLHEAPGNIFGKVQAFQDPLLTFSKLPERGRPTARGVPSRFMIAFENELHQGTSMRRTR